MKNYEKRNKYNQFSNYLHSHPYHKLPNKSNFKACSKCHGSGIGTKESFEFGENHTYKWISTLETPSESQYSSTTTTTSITPDNYFP